MKQLLLLYPVLRRKRFILRLKPEIPGIQRMRLDQRLQIRNTV